MYPEPKLSDGIRQNEAYSLLVAKATRGLWDAGGEMPGKVGVSWDTQKDYKGDDEFRVTLRDESGALAEAHFTRDELGKEHTLRGKYYHLWGRLIRGRTRELLREFNELIGEGVGS